MAQSDDFDPTSSAAQANEPLDLGSFNPLMGAANNHTIAATNGGSLVGRVYDGMTKGVAASLVVATKSIYNSAVSIGNLFGAEAELAKADQMMLSLDDDLAQYYQANKVGLDIAGEVASYLAPGLGGLKVLKLAQAGLFGKNVGSLTNVFKSAQTRNLEIAREQIASGTVFDTYTAAKYKAIANGMGEQALQAIAFETAVAATMQLAPALNKESIDVMDMATGFAKNVGIAAILGGGIGGVFEAAAVKGTLNRYLRLESKNIRPFEVTDELGKMEGGKYVVKLDLDAGTATSQMFWHLEQKQKLFETGTPLTEKEFQTLNSTVKTMETNIRLQMQNLTGGDAALANKLFDNLKHLSSDEFASALTAATKVGRVADLKPTDIAKHIPIWEAPLLVKKGQLIYDISETSSKGEVLLDNIVPSVADFASKGKVSRRANGSIDIGEGQTLPLVTQIGLKTTPLEASTAWTSWALAPKMADDVLLDLNNLPQLQRALIDQPKEFRLINKGQNQIDNLEDLQIYVRSRKEAAVERMLQEERSIDQIARILDVEKAFVEDTTKGKWMLYGVTDYTAPQYAVASFAARKGIPDSVFEVEGILNTQRRIQMARDNAAAVTLKYFKDDINQLAVMRVDTASPVDRGTSFFTSSQGFYGTIQAAAENVGRFIASKVYQKHQDNLNLLFSPEKVIRNNPQLLAEFNAVVGRLRGSDQKFVFDSTGLVFDENTIVSRAYMQDVEKRFAAASKGKDISDTNAAKDLMRAAQGEVRKPNLDEVIKLPKEIADYFRTHMQVNDSRVGSYKELVNARGQTSSLSTGTIYVPPVDTTKQNFVAFVKMADGKFGGTSERAAILAPTAEALNAKITQIKTKYGDQFEIQLKNETEASKRIKGEYDSQLLFNEPAINSTLAREGVLSDIVPRTDAYIFEEINKWHFKQEQGLMRGMVELHYGQEFAELSALGKQFTDLITSRALNVSTRTVKNPYEDIMRTALGISRLPESKLWMQLNEFAEATGTKLFNTIQEVFGKAAAGSMSWKDANTAMEKYGYKAPYSDLYSLQMANTKIPQPVVQQFVQKMNAVLATAVLRLDFLDTIMNVISLPALLGAEVAHIRRMAKDPEIGGQLSQLFNLTVPGSQAQIPSTAKLVGNSINNYFRNPESYAFVKKGGWIKNELDLHRELIDTAALKGGETASQLQAIGQKAVALGVKLTGNDWSQGFTRFIAADVMRQIGTAARVPANELNSYINTFVNRVMGNMTASQRPVMFQGAIGNAIGLFQTFQFNLAQNTFRYLETGDKKAAFLLLGMQNTLFGMQSNPAFHAINTHLVGANTPGHEDIISGVYKVAGKETADWIMYGIGSNALSTNIYSRGDLTPRYASVVPTSIADIPIVNATARFATAAWDTAKKASISGMNGEVLLQGIAAMSFNRPLAGIAQVASGNVVTKDAGNLISVSNDLFSWATLSRVAGGKPLDEAIAVDSMYRRNVYKAMDRDRLETLGAVVKAKIRSGTVEVEDWKKFSTDYAAKGGLQQNFAGWIHRQMLAADTSVVNKARKQLTDPTVQNMMAVMGGEVPDYRNTPSAKKSSSPASEAEQ